MPDLRVTPQFAESATTLPAGPVSAPNARALARWWARGANGVLRVECVADGVEQSALVLLAAGGPVGDDGMDGVRLALMCGTLAFDPMEADEPGERAALAALLWATARRASDAAGVAPTLVVMANVPPALSEAPMDPTIAHALVSLTEPVTLHDLAEQIGIDTQVLCAEISATTWLGLTTLKEAHSLQERRMRTQAPPPLVLPRSTFAPQPPTALHSDRADDLKRTLPRDPQAPLAQSAPRDPARPEPIPIHRLRREAELLRHADGWTALGIPRGSPPALITAAAARMRTRYQPLQRDPNPDAREYAGEILRHVAMAEASLGGGASDDADPGIADQTAAGGVALERGDFARADRHFSAARRIAPNDASVLAHLAWARFKNPEMKRPAREEEANELLALALQFDGDCAIAWRYKGEMARARGDMEGARTALQTSVRLSRR